MNRQFDDVVIGGGLVGLATALSLLDRSPGLRLMVLEAEPQVALHQSSHNSGVVHAGIYYEPGSLKARLCTRGKHLLEEFCARHDIPLIANGKLVVATKEDELGRLADLWTRANANHVPGLRRVGASEMREIEPLVDGVAGFYSPHTSVVDFRMVNEALARDVEERGGQIRTSFPVSQIQDTADYVEITSASGETLTARSVVVCAGLESDRLAGPAAEGLRIVPFRGGWFTVDPDVSEQINGSIYPVPDPSLPFLGVHVTRRIDGSVWAGPNAFLALSRRDYRHWAFRGRDAASALGFVGLWRFALGNLPTAWTEFTHDVSRRAYARALRDYVPTITAQHLARGPMGIRAQAMSTQGKLIDDFVIRSRGRVLYVLNAPSPAATSSLAIGEYVADHLDQ